MSKQKPKKSTAVRTLNQLDLGENEALLYTQMLSRPRSTVQELGIQAPFPRTMLYYVLKQLMQRGLVSSKKEGWRTTYIAESPERLQDILSEKEREFKKETDAVRELIPLLTQQYRLAGERPGVRTFDGIEEYKKILEDSIVSKPKILYAYETLGVSKPGLEVRTAHDRRRVSQKIQKNVLFFATPDALHEVSSRAYDDFTQFKAVSEHSLSSFSVDVCLYEDKLLYTSYHAPHEISAVLIEDAQLYHMQKSFFELLWKSGEDYTLASFTTKS